MHKKQDFDSYPIMEALMQFADDFDFPTWSNHNLEEVKTILEDVRKVIKDAFDELDELKGYRDRYEYNLYPTWYSQDGVNLDSAQFTVSLKNYPINRPVVEKYIKKTFKIQADIYFFDNFLRNMGKFFDDYDHALMLQDNLHEFNAAIRYIAGHKKSVDEFKAKMGSELGRFNMESLYEYRTYLPLISEILTGLIDSFETYDKAKHKDLKEYIVSRLAEKVSDYSIFNLYNSHPKWGTKKSDIELVDAMPYLSELLQTSSTTVFEVEKKRDSISISFALGAHPLLESSKTHAVFGLTEEVIKNLGSLPLFNQYQSGLYREELRGGVYWNYILEALGFDENGKYTDTKLDKEGKTIKRMPYEFLHVDNPFVRGLNLYHRPNTSEKTLMSIKYTEDKPDDFEDFDMESSLDVDEYLAKIEEDSEE